MMHAQGGGPSHEPQPVEWAASDEIGAMNFVQGVLMALVARYRTGKGQRMDTSQFGASIQFQMNSGIGPFLHTRQQRDDGKRPMSGGKHIGNYFATSDGKWFILQPQPKKPPWHNVFELIGRRDLCEDERFADFYKQGRNRDALEEELQKTFIQNTQQHWLAMFNEAQIACGPVHSYADLIDNDTPWANGYLEKVAVPQ